MTQWTKEQYEELSAQVGAKFLVPFYVATGQRTTFDNKWLHDDWQAIMELCVKHGVYAYHTIDSFNHVFAFINSLDEMPEADVVVESEYHNNDKSLSERVARMLALMEVQL